MTNWYFVVIIYQIRSFPNQYAVAESVETIRHFLLRHTRILAKCCFVVNYWRTLMKNIGNVPGERLAGIMADIFHKIQHGSITVDELALVAQRKNPFGDLTKPLMGDIVRIDRSKPVVYPDGYVPLYTNLPAGPSEFSLDTLEQWLHDDQKTGQVGGNPLHEYLRDGEILADCLGLIELLEIQKLGIATFRKYFAGKAVFGWRDVVRRRDGDLYVPCLIEGGDEVYLYWEWLDVGWVFRSPALRFL